ncbi:MAG: molybdopterin-synthase adenylyltransferase MoeB [Flavobacteriales bacterium]|nr:molybdopterin-synthase adenylyltransferase MoeB [Flavobacteriales bacterium]
MMLSDDEKYRYSRHLLLHQVGESGQERLKAANVLVVGAGGLGCPVLLYLSAAGVGTIGIIDFDTVEISNLQRQILFTTEDVGKNKALAAKERLQALNDQIRYEVYPERLTGLNAKELFGQYDLIVDGSDNFTTRYLVNDACVQTGKPFIHGAIFTFEGQFAVFNYQNGPTYRCLFPEIPDQGAIPNCAEVGVLGVLPGIIGMHQANETLKLLLGVGKPLSGKLMVFDALSGTQRTIHLQRNEEQVKVALGIDLKQHADELNCAQGKEKDEIDIEELRVLLTREPLQLVDVREPWEQPRIESLQALTIPLDDLPDMLDRLDPSKKTVVFCQHGGRSLVAIELLKQEGFKNLVNLTGGIVNWK